MIGTMWSAEGEETPCRFLPPFYCLPHTLPPTTRLPQRLSSVKRFGGRWSRPSLRTETSLRVAG